MNLPLRYDAVTTSKVVLSHRWLEEILRRPEISIMSFSVSSLAFKSSLPHLLYEYSACLMAELMHSLPKLVAIALRSRRDRSQFVFSADICNATNFYFSLGFAMVWRKKMVDERANEKYVSAGTGSFQGNWRSREKCAGKFELWPRVCVFTLIGNST